MGRRARARALGTYHCSSREMTGLCFVLVFTASHSCSAKGRPNLVHQLFLCAGGQRPLERVSRWLERNQEHQVHLDTDGCCVSSECTSIPNLESFRLAVVESFKSWRMQTFNVTNVSMIAMGLEVDVVHPISIIRVFNFSSRNSRD